MATPGLGAAIRLASTPEQRDAAIRAAMIGGLGLTALGRVLGVARRTALGRANAAGVAYDPKTKKWSTT
jgi:hypothetical protein